MIFSLHHVIDSLAGMLTGAYPDYPVYDSPNQQGTSFPCFFLFFMPAASATGFAPEPVRMILASQSGKRSAASRIAKRTLAS